MMMMSKRAPELVPLDGPAMPAPPGMHSNFVNPSNLNSEGLVIMLICLTLSMLVVGMRIWTKIRWVRQVVLEDCNSVPFCPSPSLTLLISFQGFLA